MPTKRSLEKYRTKRDFATTPEPGGGRAPRAGQRKADGHTRSESLRAFCVQKHLASQLHYDLRLEHRGVLLSWAVPKGPSVNPREKRLAMMTEDHPLEYADFEGVIPAGYGAGIVMLWDRGTWRLDGDDPSDEAVDRALEKGEIKFTLDGIKLKGSWVLVRTRGADSRSWLLIKHRGVWAAEVDVLAAAPDSVKSFGGFADILAAENPHVWISNRAGRARRMIADDGFHPPAKGGEAGRMFREIVQQAMTIAASRARPKRPRNRASKPSRQ